MGVGKTTIGRALAKKLKMIFIDIDKEIEKQELMTISEIFKKKGENHFRDIEKKIALKKLNEKNAVIALGGGSFIDSTVRTFAIKKCVSIWLDLDLDKIRERVQVSKKRPLLNNNNLKETLKQLYNERKEFYKLANFKIDCNKDNQSLIIEKIIKNYESQ